MDLEAIKNSPAKFEHDCSSCTFLGSTPDADLYYCMQGGFGATVIVRYSSEGPDYSSGLYGLDKPSDNPHHALRRLARDLAKERGLNVTP